MRSERVLFLVVVVVVGGFPRENPTGYKLGFVTTAHTHTQSQEKGTAPDNIFYAFINVKQSETGKKKTLKPDKCGEQNQVPFNKKMNGMAGVGQKKHKQHV